jgi:hypothetical protein
MKQAWQEVAEGFTSLGRLLKERYRSGEGDTESKTAPGKAAPGETEPGKAAPGKAAPGKADSSNEAQEAARDAAAAVRSALEQLTVAGRELGDRVADVAHDDDVKAQAKRTASSFDDALSATVNLITEQLNSAFNRSEPKSGDPGGPPAWDPPRSEDSA